MKTWLGLSMVAAVLASNISMNAVAASKDGSQVGTAPKSDRLAIAAATTDSVETHGGGWSILNSVPVLPPLPRRRPPTVDVCDGLCVI
jgi:hypothetical protein